MTIRIEVTDRPDAQELAAVGAHLATFNAGEVGPSGRRDIAVIVHDGPNGDDPDRLVAGLSGYTAWGWLYIQWLWVDKASRGLGLAGRMLEAAEAEAVTRGCHGAYIDTFNPAALKAYQRAGYKEFGRLEDFPTGRPRIWLAKALAL